MGIEFGDNRYIYVFDEFEIEYETGMKLGLIEE